MTINPVYPGAVNAPTRRNPVAAFDAVRDTLSLDGGHRRPGGSTKLDPENVDDYLSMLATLLKQGVVGTETLEVNGAPYQSFASTRLGAENLRHARPYRPDPPLRPRLDLRA